MWKVLNVKNPVLHHRLNDEDRRPISNVDDNGLKHLEHMASLIEVNVFLVQE